MVQVRLLPTHLLRRAWLIGLLLRVFSGRL